MTSCGYVCPVCEGKGFLTDLSDCKWCVEIKVDDDLKFVDFNIIDIDKLE